MKEYDVVRVVHLNRTDRQFDGSVNVKRAPTIGDSGTIVYVLWPGEAFIVESVDIGGYTVWLAEFTADELEEA